MLLAGWAWVALSSVVAVQAFAEPTAEDLEDLMSLLNTPVVTASGGVEETSATAAANITVITRADIALHGWRSLAEIIQSVPGLYVIDDLVLPSVGVRGVTGGLRAGSRIVKVMVNSAAVSFRPDLTAFLGPEFIPVEAIERVEVAKGPLSALYGANAFLATVNVITRTPKEGLEGSAQGHVSYLKAAGYGGGVLLSYGGEKGSFLAALNGAHTDRSGLSLPRTFQDVSAEQSRGDVAAPMGAYLQVRRELGARDSLTVQAGLQQLDSMGEFQVNSVLTHGTRISLVNTWTHAQYERVWSDQLSSTFNLGGSQGRPTRDEVLYVTRDNAFNYQRNFSYAAYEGGASTRWLPLGPERLALTVGADASLEQHRNLYYSQTDLRSSVTRDLLAAGERAQVNIASTGAYLQVASQPLLNLPELRMSGNLRADVPSLFPVQTSWRYAVSYAWTETFVTKLIVGRSYQTPSAVLLFGVAGYGFSNNVVGSRTRPALPQLNPQTVHSAELVSSLSLAGRLSLEGAVFAQQVDDRIEFIQLANDFFARNNGRQQNVGAELNLRGAFHPFRPYLSGAVQWTVAEATSARSGGLDFAPPPQYPSATLAAGVNVELPQYHVASNGQLSWVGPRGATQSNLLNNNDHAYTLPAYARVDLSVSSMDLSVDDNLGETRLQLTVRNLLGADYAEPGFSGFDLPALGRTLFFEMKQLF